MKKSVVSTSLALAILAGYPVNALEGEYLNSFKRDLNDYKQVITVPASATSGQKIAESLNNLGKYHLKSMSIHQVGKEFKLYPTYLETKEEFKEVEMLSKRVASEMLGMSEHDKVLFVVQRVSQLLWYNDAGNNINHSPYAVIENTGAVCQAYARLAHQIFKESGVQSTLASGTVNGEPHLWNQVLVDGKWYAVDITNADRDDTGLVDWSFVFMTRDELSQKGIKTARSQDLITNTPYSRKFKGVGLASIKDQAIYTRVEGGLVKVPISSVVRPSMIRFDSLDHFYIVGDNVLFLEKGDLTNKDGKVIASNIKKEDLKTNGTGLYNNDTLIYRPSNLEKGQTLMVEGGFNLKFTREGYTTRELDGFTNVYFDDKFIVEIGEGVYRVE